MSPAVTPTKLTEFEALVFCALRALGLCSSYEITAWVAGITMRSKSHRAVQRVLQTFKSCGWVTEESRKDRAAGVLYLLTVKANAWFATLAQATAGAGK